jgi:tetratricopeptide (TPR) repeat protein
MRARLAVLFLLVAMVAGMVGSLGLAGDERKKLPTDESGAYVLPAPLLKIASLEFSGLVSDILFLRATVFYGGTLERTERPRVKDWEWRWLHNVLDTATELDPYFYDPYYFANANISPAPGMLPAVNSLLEKGSRYRDWDWILPFYLGFNYYYQLQDTDRAVQSLLEGAQRPDAPALLTTLAARLAYREKRTENAIIFLQEILRKTDDEETRKVYADRLGALVGIYKLELAVSRYRERYAKPLASLDALIQEGIIESIPEDPYGGTFYLAPDGTVKTTSNLAYEKNSNR